jgi:hypothetical protein
MLLPLALALALAFTPDKTLAATTNCKTVAACVLGNNSSSGPGVAGTSSSGVGLSGISKSGHGVNGVSASSFGVVGITTLNASSGSNARAGVYGEDLSTNKGIYNSGVAGISKYGIGDLGETYNGVAVEGLQIEGGGFLAVPKYDNIGVYGDAYEGPGVYGYAHGSSLDSYGVGAESDYAGRSALTGFAEGDGGNGVLGYAPADGTVFIGTGPDGDVASIDGHGNEILAGGLTTFGSPLVRTRGSSGSDVMTFGERSSSPTVEDMGEATLVHGEAYVNIDRAFGAAIDPRSKYLVFLTPEGDSHGLYVTSQTTHGFAVHENGGARSTLAFDFRIVAKPYDTDASRLPAAAIYPRVKHALFKLPARVPSGE